MKISTKGQVTIPNTEVKFVLHKAGTVIQKQQDSISKGSRLLERLSGKSRVNMFTEYIMKLTRS